MKDLTRDSETAQKQKCTVLSLYVSGAAGVILYLAGLLFFAYRADWTDLLLWLVLLPFLKWVYLRFFPRISQWTAYGRVDDKLPASVKRTERRGDVLFASGLPFLPHRGTPAENAAKGDGFHAHNDRSYPQAADLGEQRNSLGPCCGGGQGSPDRERHN